MAEASTLERLRQDARDELAALIELRCRLGEDPWVFLPALPSVDEQVVATLREERLHSERWSPELSAAVWSLLDRVPSAW